jgi:hypothetical protein
MSICINYCDCMATVHRCTTWACPPIPSLNVRHAPSEHNQYAPVVRDVSNKYFGVGARQRSTTWSSHRTTTPGPGGGSDASTTPPGATNNRMMAMTTIDERQTLRSDMDNHMDMKRSSPHHHDSSSSAVQMTRFDRALSLDDDDNRHTR